jgi:hypothetical protein
LNGAAVAYVARALGLGANREAALDAVAAAWPARNQLP